MEAVMRNSGNSRLLWAAGKYLTAEEQLEQLEPGDSAIAARLRRSIRQTRRRLLKATRSIQHRPGPTHFRNVLVAVDGDAASCAAWRAAADLAMELGAKLILVHVIDVLPFISTSRALADDGDDGWTLRRAQAERLLSEVQSSYPAKVPVREVIRLGEPREGILATAREWHADLVVIGSHQRLPLVEAMMGGTTAYVERHLKCPVVLVPEADKRSAVHSQTAPSAEVLPRHELRGQGRR
jgi:nucleotide-binding universal stress UspA family protein